MATGYVAFVRSNVRFLGFGMVVAVFSSFGQTFFISLFSGEFRAAFGLSHGEFGSIYSIATVASGLSIIWAGRLIDHYALKSFSLAVCALMTVACLLTANVQGSILLGIAIYLLRLSGQGLLSHTAMTSMARSFDADRGKAISIANLGFPLGEALFPLIGVALIVLLGWRGAWITAALAVAFILPPLVVWLLKGHPARDCLLHQNQSGIGNGPAGGRVDWTCGEVLHDRRFYMLLPAVVSLSFIGTGVIFHHIHLVETKGWSITWFASTFIGSAAATVLTSLAVGPLIDRFTACRLFPMTMISSCAALLVLAKFDHPLTALAYMILFGISTGMYRGAMAAIWAELYGVRHLGAIRGLATSLTVLGSALSPFSMGLMIDAGFTMEALVMMCFVYLVIAIFLAMLAMRDRVPHLSRP